MKKLPTVFAILLIAEIALAAPKQITIFHTNDIHGHFLPEKAEWRDGGLVGGVAELERRLTALRKLTPNSLYLDAGDLMTGNPICGMPYNGVRGAALLEMLHRLGATAMCLGNHEFDLGADHVLEFIHASPIPVLCSNITRKSDGKPIATTGIVTEIDGVRIAVIGLVLDDLAGSVAKHCIEPFNIENCALAAQREIDRLDPGSDLIILLTHYGLEKDRELARAIHGADVIVGGHSHTRLKEPVIENGVIIVQAGSHCKNLGALSLTLEDDRVIESSGRLEELVYNSEGPRTGLSMFADSLEVVIQAKYGEVIGRLAEEWKRSYYSVSNVGNWICDRLRSRYKTDIALVNSGGIRTNLNPGLITRMNVLELLPFENSIVLVQATGAELLKIAEEQCAAQGFERHGALEMSGLEIEYRKQDGRAEILRAEVNGERIEPDRMYSIASIDYVVISQPEKYFGFAPSNPDIRGEMISTVIMEEFQKATQPVLADPKQRLREVKP